MTAVYAHAMTDITTIQTLLLERGGELYGGESVTQLDQALQCAMLAERAIPLAVQ